MKVPLSWLKEYISTSLTAAQIADTLTNVGLEVESIRDSIFEIALTPNFAHSASIRGIARELSAATQESLTPLKFPPIEEDETSIQELTSITVENPVGCPRYACRLITGVLITPSPAWLRERIEQCGMRSVNNVVDVTNLVLLELGQPMHAFDFDRLAEQRIVVRNARQGEKIITLDGKEHYPTEETLLICDAKKAIAIAGIMGSADTEVSEKTTSILLESAFFKPSEIRRTGKRMGIHSDGSYRFERGTDPNGVIEALERATSLICSLSGGKTSRGVLDVKSQEFQPTKVSCRLSRINRILGTHLAMSEVETIFRLLGLTVAHIQEDHITVKAPTYRHDIHYEIDLIEEVARLYGYDNLHKKEKAFFRTSLLSHSPEYVFTRKVRCRLISEGLQEFLTCDLISPTQAALISTDNFPSRALIKLLNPHSIEHAVMRPSMLPGMLSVVKYNADHDIYSIAGFEVGRVHFTAKERYYEPAALSIVLTGERAKEQWEKKEGCVDFFDLKGIVVNFLEGIKIPLFSFCPSRYSNFHPKRQAVMMIENIEVGIIGEIHPLTLKEAGLEQPVYFAELNLEDLHRFVREVITMEPLPQFPASTRDWTVTLAEHIEVGTILKRIEHEQCELLESCSLLDLYRSDTLGSKRKNVTFRFVYRDRRKTLSLSAVEKEHFRITKSITEYLQRKSHDENSGTTASY